MRDSPSLAECVFHIGRIEVKIGHELFMRPVGPIFRWARWEVQELGDLCEVEIEEKGPVKQKVMTESALGVSGDFVVTEGQVRVASDAYLALENAGERRGVPFHDQAVRSVDGGERSLRLDLQNQGIVQAARALEHGAPTAAATEDRQPVLFAGFRENFPAHLASHSQYHEGQGRRPESQSFACPALLCFQQQGFIQCEVLGRRIQCEV